MIELMRNILFLSCNKSISLYCSGHHKRTVSEYELETGQILPNNLFRKIHKYSSINENTELIKIRLIVQLMGKTRVKNDLAKKNFDFL